MALSEILTDSLIRQMAGSRSYARGEGYYLEERVIHLAALNEKISATVAGTHDYRVRLWEDGNGLGYSCDCPIGLRDDFCKHCVVVALEWLAQNASGGESVSDDRGRQKAASTGATTKGIRSWLMSQDRGALADMLLDAATEDPQLENRLALRAAATNGVNLATYKKVINQAVGRGRFIDYQEMPTYWRHIDTAIDGIEELLDRGHAEAVIELGEYALARVERAIEHVDDSDGYMSQLLWRLQQLHLAACMAAKPDPEALAGRLFTWELEGDWDTFSGAAQTYADVLGDVGIAHYRELAEAAWGSVKPLEPGDDDPDRYGRRFRITQIMESLARLSGSLEQLIAIKQRDLSSSYAFLEIAQACLGAGENEEALAWAEKGLQTFGVKADSRLKDLLAGLYHERQRHDEAMALIWPQFERRPSLATYQKLKQNAEHSNSWPAWRQRALDHSRKMIDKEAQDHPSARKHFGQWSDRSLLVEIFLWENDVEAAWHEACEGGCSDFLWLQLARRREEDHPRDAITVYQKLVGPIIGRTNNSAYAEAVVLIRRMKNLLNGPGESEEFRQYVGTLRRDFKRKRNFMKLLDTL